MTPRQAAAKVAFAACVVCFVGAADPASAHGPIHEQIADITARIQRDPQNAALYLRRGDLLGLDGDCESALADFVAAERLAPRLGTLDLARGHALLRCGRLAAAREPLDRFLAAHPDHRGARALRARVLLALGDFRGAAGDYDRALAGLAGPAPDDYVARASAWAAAGEPERALRGLDEGIVRLGPIVSLELPAIEIELSRGRLDAALARVDTIAARTPRREPWLARRAEILERADRADEARAACEAALLGLAKARPTRTNRELEGRLQAMLARLNAGPRRHGE